MKCCEKSFGPKNEKEDRGQKKLEKKKKRKKIKGLCPTQTIQNTGHVMI